MSSQGTLFAEQRRKVQRGRWRPPETLPDLSAYRAQPRTRVGFDTEGTGKDKHRDRPVGLSVALPDGKDFYLPWGHQDGGNLDPQLVKRWARNELRDLVLVGLNSGHDAEQTLKFGVDLEAQGNTMHDVAHSAALLNEYRYSGLNLDSLGKEYVGRGKEPCPVEGKNIWRAHSSLVGPYAEGDARLALDVDRVQRPLLEKDGLFFCDDLEDDLIWPVNEMERNGARLDMEKLARWRREVREAHQDAILGLHRATGLKLNPNSPPDLHKLFTRLGLKSPAKTETGAPSYDNNVLMSFAKHHPEVQLALRARRAQSLRSKYLDQYWENVKKNGTGDVLRFNLYQLRGDEYGTISGRFSSAHVNIQQVFSVENQIDKLGDEWIIRELFVPDEGFDFFSADASQIEFRLFVHYAASPRLLQAYLDDPMVDFHTIVQKIIHQVDTSVSRKKAKTGNFLAVYGGGVPAAMGWLNCDEEEAQQFLDLYHGAFPEARRLGNKASNLARRRGYVKTIFGMKARFGQNYDKYHAALNRVIQGTAAGVNKVKLRDVYRERKTLGIHKLRMTVHDEVAGDLDRDPVYRQRLQEFLDEQCYKFTVPILWEVATGKNWRECA